jgi:hypothetical protein
MKKPTFFLLIFIVGVSFFSSCSKEDVNLNEIINTENQISVKDGMLVFKDQQVYQKTIESLSGLSREALNNWEGSFEEFQSQRFIFEKAVDEDYQFIGELERQLEDGIISEADFTNPEEVFAPYVELNKDLFAFTGEGGFSLKVAYYSPQIEYFLNRDGLVQIGDSIYQYKEGYMRIITDGDLSKVESLDSHFVSTENITVAKLYREVIDSESSRTSDYWTDRTFVCDCAGYSSGGGQRVRGNLFMQLWVYDYGSYKTSAPYVYYRAINEEHKFFGWRTKRTSSLRIVLSNVSYSISSSATTLSDNNINVDQGTGGDLKTEIFVIIHDDISPGYYVSSWTLSTGGNAYFYGRSSTSCSIIGGCQKTVSAPQ